jgi:hypothetical protein
MLLFGVACVGGLFIVRRRRKTRWPFKETDRLLRGPGEGLRHRLVASNEKFLIEFVAYAMAVLLVWPTVAFIGRAMGASTSATLVSIVIALLIVTAVSASRVIRLAMRWGDDYLGWFGERLTAEKLLPLQSLGYRIFHDVPAEPGGKGWNIDHVVVGPTGVAVVEVKTRRKGRARPGYRDHEVSFDGTQLDWPWGHDREAIQQALNEADRITKIIHERTGLRTTARAVIALPGWFVRESPSPKLRVVNPQFLPDAIHGRGVSVLSAEQIDLIARQLDVICRDVAD